MQCAPHAVCRAGSSPDNICRLKLGGGQKLEGDHWRGRREISFTTFIPGGQLHGNHWAKVKLSSSSGNRGKVLWVQNSEPRPAQPGVRGVTASPTRCGTGKLAKQLICPILYISNDQTHSRIFIPLTSFLFSQGHEKTKTVH